MGQVKDRMESEMKLRGFSPHTSRCYLGCARDFVRHMRRPPAELGKEEIRNYLLYLLNEKQVSSSYFNQALAALRFLYQHVLERGWEIEKIPFQKKRLRLPVVLSTQEVQSIFTAVRNLKHRLCLMTSYAAGLRLSEVISLQPHDIDSARMLIRVRDGKGRKDRYVMLAQFLLISLREYWKIYKPGPWLFPGRATTKPAHISSRSLQHVFQKARIKAGIHKPASFHSLRHSFATHLLEAGTGIHHIRLFLGHRSIQTTLIYTHVTPASLANIVSPLDRLNGISPPLTA